MLAPNKVNKNGRTLLQSMRDRWHRLDSKFSSWREHYRDISSVFMPRIGEYFAENRNDGWKRNEDIIDNSPAQAVRILAAGLTSGASSPARQWFKVRIRDMKLRKRHDLIMWADDVTRIIMDTFAHSNTYRVLERMYVEAPLFGTAAAIVVPHEERGIHIHHFTAGQYRIANGPEGNVTCLFREVEMTVAQVVREFGHDKCSDRVQSLYDQGSLEEGVTVLHGIEPRYDREPGMTDNKNMPYRSVYWEKAEAPDQVVDVLRESGFNQFPGLVPRWGVNGNNDYGDGPGMEALGDCVQLQQEQFRKSQLIDYTADPAVVLPSGMKNQEVDTGPGGVSYDDGSGNSQAARALWQVSANGLTPIREDISEVQARIRASFFADMFLMIAQSDKRMTATEVTERHEEKLLMLGPALERLHNEMLEPLVNLTFQYLMDAGKLPPVPEDLIGSDVDVEFVSMLAQTQRSVGAKTTDRFMATVGAVSQMKPEALDKINVDEFIDDLAERLGVPARIVNSTEDVLEIREGRAQAQMEQAQIEQAQQQAGIAKDVAHAASMAPTPPESQFSAVAGNA